MIELTFSAEILIEHFSKYFGKSLFFYPKKYLSLFLNDGLIPDHAAYLCPLCVTNFIVVLPNENKVLATSNFDLDHYPQQSIGGKNSILVCKTCNNEAGHDFEYDLKAHLQLLSFENHALSQKVKVKNIIPNVGRFNGQLWKNESGNWEVILKPNESIKIRPLDELIDSMKISIGQEFQITLPLPNDTHIKKAFLKTAYLYCFAYWGYEFAFSKAGVLLRDVLSDKAEYPMNILPLKFDRKNMSAFDKIPIGVCYISNPLVLKSFVVNIKLEDKKTGVENIYPVFIPNPTDAGIEALNDIQKTLDSQFKGDISITPLNSKLNETPLAYSQTWQEVQQL